MTLRHASGTRVGRDQNPDSRYIMFPTFLELNMNANKSTMKRKKRDEDCKQ